MLCNTSECVPHPSIATASKQLRTDLCKFFDEAIFIEDLTMCQVYSKYFIYINTILTTVPWNGYYYYDFRFQRGRLRHRKICAQGYPIYEWQASPRACTLRRWCSPTSTHTALRRGSEVLQFHMGYIYEWLGFFPCSTCNLPRLARDLTEVNSKNVPEGREVIPKLTRND